MFNRTFTALSLLLIAATAFAQQAPKKVLSQADINAFNQHIEAINRDLESVESPIDIMEINPMAMDEGNDLTAYITNMRNTPASPAVQAIFRKYGLGDNGFEKYLVILFSVSAEATKREMAEVRDLYAVMPEGASFIASIDSMITQMEAALHRDDRALVLSQIDSLISLIDDDDD